MEKPFKCHMVNWDEAHRLAKILACRIKSSGFKPDFVIGIGRGGLIPACIVCDFLLQKDLAAIKVEHWGTAEKQEKAIIKFTLPMDICGKKILIVDDVADTGDTLSETMGYIRGLNPSESKTAVLHYKTCSTFVPDYWGEKQHEWEWIMYPWALYEELTVFIERLLIMPLSFEDVRKGLKRDFDIKISEEDLLEILNSGEFNRMEKGKKIFWSREIKMIRTHVFISGRVQGVFFRSSTRDKAMELGITGWVRNLFDGRVEAVFEGEKENVEKIVQWCRKGNKIAKVEDVEIVYDKYTGEFNGFSIRYL